MGIYINVDHIQNLGGCLAIEYVVGFSLSLSIHLVLVMSYLQHSLHV